MLSCQRDAFDIPEHITFLNCAFVGPLPNVSADAAADAASRKRHAWELKAGDFFTVPERARAAFAKLIGANSDDVALAPAVSYGMALAARCIPLQPGQRVLLMAEEFPSTYFTWKRACEAAGAELVILPRPHDGDWTRAFLSAIDRRTAVVSTAPCHWTDGSLVRLEDIGNACREVGAALAVDGIQAIGAMPFSVEAVQPDFVMGATYKWLLGPYAYGFCYVAPKWQGCAPIEENWINHAGSENFSTLTDYRLDYQQGARRFDMGERAGFGIAEPAAESAELLLTWGVDNISAYCRALTREALAHAQVLGLEALPEAHYAPHMIGLRLPRPVPHLAAKLAEAGVHVSLRGANVRISPNIYNTKADIARLFTALEGVL